jgi:transcriptional regulator with XRE-family HTH domain
MPPGRLGRMLKTLREAKGLTQVELAKKARIGQGYLAQLEGGVKKNPSLAVLKRLARAVGVSVEQLLK